MRAGLRVRLRGPVAAVTAVVAVASGVAAAALTAAPVRATGGDRLDGPSCARAVASAAGLNADLSLLATERVITARDQRIDLRANAWTFPGQHPTTALQLNSSGWLVAYASTDLVDAVELAVEQATANPDPGASVPPSQLVASGWVEAAVTGRMDSIRCLYRASADPRLIPVVEALAAANMDEARYYGPPRRKPHNHGAMANRALLQTAEQFSRPEWADFARSRIAEAAARTFDECGMVFEQSASYQEHNTLLWSKLVNQIPDGAADSVAAQARAATSALIRPDGILPGIGAGQQGPAKEGFTASAATMWCPRTGWAVFADAAAAVPQHAIIRFGPRRIMHGHEDKGAFTWWVGGADGVPVLSDPGSPDKRLVPQVDWALSQRAHSVLQRTTDPFLRGWAGETSATREGRRYVLRTTRLRDTAERTITFTNRMPVVSVDDRVTVADDGVLHRYRQRFVLDPVWQRVLPAAEGDVNPPYLAQTSDGHTLDVVCIANDVIVQPSVVDVEWFPTKTTVVPALQVVCPLSSAGDVRMRALVFVDTVVESVAVEGEWYAVRTDRGIVLLGPHRQVETVALPVAPPL